MRSIVRKIKCTKVQVLESVSGNVQELDTIALEGDCDVRKVKKELSRRYPDKNVFYGNMTTDEKTYRMTAEEFMELATVIE